jgi:hypothetical protein
MGQRLTILFILISSMSRGQQSDFELVNIKFKGLEFKTTKENIIKSFGQGKKLETDYECGFFTNDQAGGPYYQLVYADFNFIGSDKEDFILQSVKFDSKGNITIRYKDKELSRQTNKEDSIKIMYGDKEWEKLKNRFDIDVLIIYSKNGDDGAKFIFKDGRLDKFEYWTPC